MVGLDRNAAKEAFGKYLQGSSFNATQIRFVETIIDYLTQNGVMDAGLLYLHSSCISGVFFFLFIALRFIPFNNHSRGKHKFFTIISKCLSVEGKRHTDSIIR
ncbi:type I restriction-modification enzyme R subunit C-terminal domain-containing protein [Nostoc sp. FACHB-145]|uniref:type I restriction-modification enzyme R subunit C-terminal domain-containing protein n=1 Tax=Nostoc sp. FACHB-145 TaxID=2692836 RepID=UPI0028C49579|nr:type I restriction-modification enzyme R subunit C-terminal domain-containing protein [Nostoc sp. FACHB-145]